MGEKNRVCPECRKHDHDTAGDHLYLASDGVNWICAKVQYHENQQYYVVPNDPDTMRPVEDVGEKTEKVPEKPATSMFGGGNTLDSILAGNSVSSQPATRNDIDALPAVKFRDIPADIRKKYGVHHELSVEDRSVTKVFYPIYSEGVQTRWKERNVAEKKFYVKEM